jgi:hypothetical protein
MTEIEYIKKLVKVFEKYFGHFVVLETNNPELLKYMQK